MAKLIPDSVLDAGLQVITGADAMWALPSEPAGFGAGDGAKLASVAMAGGDFSIGSASGGGRRLSVTAKTGVAVLASGTATHVALVDMAASEILAVTTCAAEVLEEGGTVDFGSFDVTAGVA